MNRSRFLLLLPSALIASCLSGRAPDSNPPLDASNSELPPYPRVTVQSDRTQGALHITYLRTPDPLEKVASFYAAFAHGSGWKPEEGIETNRPNARVLLFRKAGRLFRADVLAHPVDHDTEVFLALMPFVDLDGGTAGTGGSK